MKYRLAINGYGRIGRCVLRALYDSNLQRSMQIVAINELCNSQTMSHLTKYDSTHGRFPGEIDMADETLFVNADKIALSHEAEAGNIDWQSHNIDLVLECSGAFTKRSDSEKHLSSGAKRVLVSQPVASDDTTLNGKTLIDKKRAVDATIVYGVNHQFLSKEDQIISNASCTTNAIVPVIKTLNDTLGIEFGTVTTIHSAMNDQPVIDAYHHTDLRKTRAAGQSIIPVDTELSKGIERLLPELAGRFSAQALRVPTVNVSAMDLTVVVRRDSDEASINALLKESSRNELSGIMGFIEEPLASCDFNHDSRSAIVDAGQTRVSGKHLVKVLIWFDNEWAYANRMLDVAKIISQL